MTHALFNIEGDSDTHAVLDNGKVSVCGQAVFFPLGSTAEPTCVACAAGLPGVCVVAGCGNPVPPNEGYCPGCEADTSVDPVVELTERLDETLSTFEQDTAGAEAKCKHCNCWLHHANGLPCCLGCGTPGHAMTGR